MANKGRRALVIDDDEVILEACRAVLQRNGFEVDVTTDAVEGRDLAIRGPYSLVLVDMRMPILDGMEVLRSVRERRSDLEVIMITAYSTVESAVKAVKLGAFDYLPKPFTPEELMSRVRAAMAHLNERLAKRQECKPAGLVGASPAMLKVFELIARIGPTDSSVLIIGETGTGKELVAHAIHLSSQRREGPFVPVDCSALSPGLLESELFGHVKGAFTGAVASKPGLFAVADGGTLFLDEVASMGLETQAKLLRFLESKEVRPVGGVEARRLDVRIVAATNKDLLHMVGEGTFREDLYYRLNVLPIVIPPLRERPEDIPLLARHFLMSHHSPNARRPTRFSPEALEALMAYPWPGNVRELRNLVERLVVTVDGDVIGLEHLPEPIRSRRASRTPVTVPRTYKELKALKRAMSENLTHDLERTFVIEALRRNNWNVSRAARETGILRPNFHALMRKHGIRAEEEERRA